MKRMARAFTAVSLFLIIMGAAMAEELRSFHGRVVSINGLTMASFLTTAAASTWT